MGQGELLAPPDALRLLHRGLRRTAQDEARHYGPGMSAAGYDVAAGCGQQEQ